MIEMVFHDPITKKMTVGTTVALIVLSTTLIGAAYAYTASYEQIIESKDILKNSMTVSVEEELCLGNLGVESVWDSSTTRTEAGDYVTTYTNGRFVDASGKQITEVTVPVGSVLLENESGAVSIESKNIHGALSSPTTPNGKTNATTNAVVIITPTGALGIFNVSIKYTLITTLEDDTDYCLPAYTLTITYDSAVS